MVLFGPPVKEKDSSTPTFYVTLETHELLFHNCIIDLGASNNLMPLPIMDQLGLEITKPYKDMYSIDSKIVKYLETIKDLAVNFS